MTRGDERGVSIISGRICVNRGDVVCLYVHERNLLYQNHEIYIDMYENYWSVTSVLYQPPGWISLYITFMGS